MEAVIEFDPKNMEECLVRERYTQNFFCPKHSRAAQVTSNYKLNTGIPGCIIMGRVRMGFFGIKYQL